jgi:hypothetical protein
MPKKQLKYLQNPNEPGISAEEKQEIINARASKQNRDKTKNDKEKDKKELRDDKILILKLKTELNFHIERILKLETELNSWKSGHLKRKISVETCACQSLPKKVLGSDNNLSKKSKVEETWIIGTGENEVEVNQGNFVTVGHFSMPEISQNNVEATTEETKLSQLVPNMPQNFFNSVGSSETKTTNNGNNILAEIVKNEIGMDTAASDTSPYDVTPDPALVYITPSCIQSGSDTILYTMVSQKSKSPKKGSPKKCIFSLAYTDSQLQNKHLHYIIFLFLGYCVMQYS